MRQKNHPVEQDEVMAYLDGELSTEEATRAAAHLKECRECQRLAANLKSVSEVLTEWQVESRDPQNNTNIDTALEDREWTRSGAADGKTWLDSIGLRGWRPWNWGVAIAGIAVLLVSFATHLYQDAAPSPGMALRREPTPGRETDVRPRVTYGDPRAQDLLLYAPAPTASGTGADTASREMLGEVPNHKPAGAMSAPAFGAKGETSGITAIIRAPMIARSAQLTLTTKDFEKARIGIDEILRRHRGYVAELSVTSPSNVARRFTATLRMPADELESTLVELKTLGRVESESQSGEEVTAQDVDLVARLANARNTEKRLTDLLRQQTGKLSDVLTVETEISRVRGEIESMEAEKKLLTQRVEFATLNTTVTEEYRAQAQVVPDSLGTRFHNAAIDGYQSVVNGVIDFLLWLMSYGPALLLWAAILFFPARFLWRKLRHR